MTYEGYQDKEKRKEYNKDYMQKYRERQSEEDIRRDAEHNGMLDLFESFIQEQMELGHTREQAIAGFASNTMPSELQDSESARASVVSDSIREEIQPVCGNKLKEPEPRQECFGTYKVHLCNGSCKKSCLEQYCKLTPAQKETDRVKVLVGFFDECKETAEKIEARQRRAALAVMVEIGRKQAEEFDALVKKYTDRGVEEKEAEESAHWEMKQIQAAAYQEHLKRQDAWDLMSEEEQTAHKMKLLDKSKKLLEGSK